MNLVSPGSFIFSSSLVYLISLLAVYSKQLMEAGGTLNALFGNLLSQVIPLEVHILLLSSHSNSVTNFSFTTSRASPFLQLPMTFSSFSFELSLGPFWGRTITNILLTAKCLLTSHVTLKTGIGSRSLLGHHPAFQTPESGFYHPCSPQHATW